MKFAAQALGQRRLDVGCTGLERFHLGTQIPERVLPGGMLAVPARLQIGAAGGQIIVLLLQRVDVGHRLERRVLELLDVLARGIDLFPGCRVLLLVLHLHELSLILLQKLLLVCQLAIDAPPFFRVLFDLSLQPLHFGIDVLPLAVDRCK